MTADGGAQLRQESVSRSTHCALWPIYERREIAAATHLIYRHRSPVAADRDAYGGNVYPLVNFSQKIVRET